MNENEIVVLKHLNEIGKISDDFRQEAKNLNLSQSTYASAAESLVSKQLATKKINITQSYQITARAENYLKVKLPETQLLNAVSRGAKTLQEVIKDTKMNGAEVNVALGIAIKNKLVITKKENNQLIIEKNTLENPVEIVFEKISKNEKLDSHHQEYLKVLLERQLIALSEYEEIRHSITVLGKQTIKDLKNSKTQISQLTPTMLKDGSWKDADFRPYDLTTVATPMQTIAKKHPYKEFLNRIRYCLSGLGFREVDSSLIELEFWNMDALFMPQDHPAREIHDVFRISNPAVGQIADEKIYSKVYDAHLFGGNTGSTGWKYKMKKEISSRILARSHDTGISARELAKNQNVPDRVFFISKAFRPDQIDWKHFIEFNQLGGYIADENITLSDLLGILELFAKEVFNAKKVKFAPNYFPFTEPSVEIYADIPGRGWSEVGGAGMFRPEMLSALGIEHPVAAWGLGIDRLAMLSIGANDIRQLHSQDLDFLKGKNGRMD